MSYATWWVQSSEKALPVFTEKSLENVMIALIQLECEQGRVYHIPFTRLLTEEFLAQYPAHIREEYLDLKEAPKFRSKTEWDLVIPARAELTTYFPDFRPADTERLLVLLQHTYLNKPKKSLVELLGNRNEISP